jgi:hypothetical protein
MHFYTAVLTAIISIFLVSNISAGETDIKPANDADTVSEVFSSYATLLERHLIEKDLENDGLVTAFDYQEALAQDDTMDLLNTQRQNLAGFNTDLIDTREKGNAFWLNAYNFFMIAHILQDRPNNRLVASVWDYGGRYNPFQANIFQRELFNIGGRLYSLDQMQKEILLGRAYRNKGWADARTHFVINCASVGCPPLRGKIFTPSNIDHFLTENTRRSLNTHRHLHMKGSTLYLSSIFNWYTEDFQREEGSVINFINKYADNHIIEKLKGIQQVRYIDYDWSLNKPENFPELKQDVIGSM